MRPKYKTKQRESLINYLETVPGVHITAGDVCEYFKSQGLSIGLATVYRQLESLVDEGIVNKYVIGANSSACFEYVGNDSHEDAVNCLHCKCEKCGKLIHLSCEEMLEFKEHLLEHHGFAINPMRTVFYGLCEKCRQNYQTELY